MKKAILLSTIFAIFFLPKSNAQQFSFVTSFGVTQSWGMPYEVVHAIEHDYWGYDVIHTRRINQNGKLFFDVVLQRGDVFVTVSLGRYGRIYNRTVAYDYPFYNHVCNGYCGYHSNYYTNHMVVCNSSHHHNHNHVTNVTYYGNSHAHGQSNGNKSYAHDAHRQDYKSTNSYKSRANSSDYQNSKSRPAQSQGNSNSYKSRSNTSASSGRSGTSSSVKSRSSSSSSKGTSTKSRSTSTSQTSSGRSRFN